MLRRDSGCAIKDAKCYRVRLEVGRQSESWDQPNGTLLSTNTEGVHPYSPNCMNTKRTIEIGKLAHRAIGLTLLLGVMCAGAANGQNANDVVVTLKAQKVERTRDGKEVLRVADRAIPGEVIQYDAVYRNQGKKGIRNLQPTLPIPSGLEYLPDSAKPAPRRLLGRFKIAGTNSWFGRCEPERFGLFDNLLHILCSS